MIRNNLLTAAVVSFAFASPALAAPRKAEYSESIDRCNVKTSLTLSDNGRLDVVIEIDNKNGWFSHGFKPIIYLLDEQGNVLSDPIQTPGYAVDANNRPWGTDNRRDEFHAEIPESLAAKVHSVSVVHLTITRNGFEILGRHVEEISKLLEKVEGLAERVKDIKRRLE